MYMYLHLLATIFEGSRSLSVWDMKSSYVEEFQKIGMGSKLNGVIVLARLSGCHMFGQLHYSLYFQISWNMYVCMYIFMYIYMYIRRPIRKTERGPKAPLTGP